MSLSLCHQMSSAFQNQIIKRFCYPKTHETEITKLKMYSLRTPSVQQHDVVYYVIQYAIIVVRDVSYPYNIM